MIALILNFITLGTSNILLFSVYRFQLTDILGYLRIFTHILGHANFEHFYSNMILILLIGPILEEKYGSKNIAIMIIFTAFITGLFNIIFINNMLLGASGIDFMLIILISFVNIKNKRIPLTLILITILYIGGEIYDISTKDDNISQVTHILGGICGAGFGYIFNKNKLI